MRNAVDEPGDRRTRILRGAGSAFLRYGFARTSMADIASEAGVSRTALYHYFLGKEEILQAVTEELHARTLDAATAALAASETLEAALSGLLQAKFGQTLALITGSPHAAELVDATHRFSGPATHAADTAFHALVVQAFVRHGRTTDVEAVADTLTAAAKGLMRAGEAHVSQARFAQRIERLVRWATN